MLAGNEHLAQGASILSNDNVQAKSYLPCAMNIASSKYPDVQRNLIKPHPPVSNETCALEGRA